MYVSVVLMIHFLLQLLTKRIQEITPSSDEQVILFGFVWFCFGLVCFVWFVWFVVACVWQGHFAQGH